MKLSPISLAVLPLLTVFTANAAVYQIVELDTTNTVRSTAGVATTPQGDVIANGSTLLDVEIDLDAIDFDSDIMTALLTEEQITQAKSGTIDATIASILINYFQGNPSSRFQPIGTTRALKFPQNGTLEQIVLRDSALSKTNNEFIYSVNNAGAMVGIATAPSTKETFTPTAEPVAEGEEEAEVADPYTAWVPEPAYLLGYYATGTTVTALPPAYTELGGGMSAGLGLNNNNQIVGYTGIGVSDTLVETVTALCPGFNVPVQYCVNQAMSIRGINLSNLLAQISSFNTLDGLSEGYQERAALWQVATDGSVTLNRTWGFLGEKGSNAAAPASEDYAAPVYYSHANAVNNSGTAVGHSMYTDTSRITTFFDSFGQEIRRVYAAPHATIFNGDEVTGFINPEEWLASVAVDINEQNLITGYALKSINSVVRRRLFTYDMATQTVNFPTGFFNSSSTVPRAINNNGDIVGRAEVIIGGTTTRRFHAFIYNNGTDTFTDLNDLVGCDAPYTLVEATGINDDGEILATALVKRVVYNFLGEPITDDNGVVVEEEQATAVKLQPIANGQVENCNTEATTYERQSGTFNAVWLMLLAALPLLRRRMRLVKAR